ncbi:MAG: FecR domain-containing protein [Verrucomicrobiota bacterium]|nr:FecR domain-containing protein [Verrucomicrobiota bacterium]
MKPVGRFSKVLGWAVALTVALCVTTAEAKQNKAVVRAVRGDAQVQSEKGGAWKPAKVGMTLNPSSSVRTAAEGTVDLFLGDNGPVVRVTSDTTLGLDRLDVENTGVEKVIETQLDLKNGRILGNVKKLAAASKYEVKTPRGVAGIRGTEYDISANGTVTVISGNVTVVYVNLTTGETVTANVGAGQTVSPPTGNTATVESVDTTTLNTLRGEVTTIVIGLRTNPDGTITDTLTGYQTTPDGGISGGGQTTGDTTGGPVFQPQTPNDDAIDNGSASPIHND